MNIDDLSDKFGGMIRGSGIIGKVSVNTTLNPLIWIVALFCLLLAFSFFMNINDWRIICIFVFMGIFLIAVLIAYAFFARTNPDALRSETYNLEVKKYQYESMGQKGKEIPIEEVTIGDAETNKLKAINKGDNKSGK